MSGPYRICYDDDKTQVIHLKEKKMEKTCNICIDKPKGTVFVCVCGREDKIIG